MFEFFVLLFGYILAFFVVIITMIIETKSDRELFDAWNRSDDKWIDIVNRLIAEIKRCGGDANSIFEEYNKKYRDSEDTTK